MKESRQVGVVWRPACIAAVTPSAAAKPAIQPFSAVNSLLYVADLPNKD